MFILQWSAASLDCKNALLETESQTNWSHLSYLCKWEAFLSLSFPGRKQKEKPWLQVKLCVSSNCCTKLFLMCLMHYFESKGWRCSSVCLETKAQSGDEKGICLQVGRNWSSRHLCMMRAGVSCWPGGVQQQAAGTGTITSFSASGECGCGKVKISPTRIIKITMIKKSKDKHIQECHYSACSTLSMGCVQGHRNKFFLLNGKLRVSLRSEAQFKGIIPHLWACRICTLIKQCKCEESG